MMRAVIFSLAVLAVLAMNAAVAQPFTRILWYEIEEAPAQVRAGEQVAFELAAARWWRLRVFAEESAEDDNARVTQPPALWSSAGDGVFVSHQPIDADHQDDFSDYFYRLATPAKRVILLENKTDDDLRVSLHRSETESLPNHDQNAQIELSTDRDNTTLTQRSGFESHDFQRLQTGDIYPQEFNEAGLYHLEIKVPWHKAWQLREQVTVRAGYSDQRPDKVFALAAQPDTSTLYEEDEDASQKHPQLLSRSVLIPFYIEEAGQQIQIDVDRNAYVRWLATDAGQQFLFSRNAPRAVAQARSQQLAFEQRPPVTTSFYRSLPPAGALQTDVFVAATGGMKEPDDRVLPAPAGAAAEAAYFYQLNAGKQVDFALPRQTQSPPVRLALKWPDREASLVVHSSAGEQKRIRYLPDVAIAERWQFDNSALQALANSQGQPRHLITETMLEFTRPFQSIAVHNTGDAAAWFRLEYRNEQRLPPSEQLWLNRIDGPIKQALRRALVSGRQTDLAGKTIADPVINEVMAEWRTRLEARAQQFTERYPSEPLAGERSIGEAEFEHIKASLEAAFDVQLEDLADVYSHMMSLGYNYTARQLLVDFAVGKPSPLQSRAEEMLLTFFVMHERWFDFEGYWAWRMINRNDPDTLEHIAFSWLFQNRFRESLHLFALLDPHQIQQGYVPYVVRASELEKGADPTPHNWVKQRPAFDGQTREALIYNQDLQQYLSTLYLADSAPLTTEITGVPRLQLTLYPVLQQPPLGDEPVKALSVTVNQQTYQLAIRLDRASDSLSWSQDDAIQVGLPQNLILELDPDQANTLVVETHGFEAGFVIETTERLQPATPQLRLRLSELLLAHQRGQVDAAQIKNIKAETLQASALTDEQSYLMSQLTEDYGWQRFDAVGASDGIAYLEYDRWQPTAPGLQLRNALMLSPIRKGERRLNNDEQARLEVELREPMRLQLHIRKAGEITAPAAPVNVRVSTPDGDKTLAIDLQGQSLPLELAAGRHLIGLSFAEPSNAIVLYRLTTKDGESALPPNQIKTYRASTEQAVKLFIPANSLLRTDHYKSRDDSASHNYQWFAEDTFHTVAHTSSGEYSYYRFFLWEQQPPVGADETLVTQAPTTEKPAPEPPTIWPLEGTQSVFADTLYELDEQADGSWGFDLGYRVRSNFDEGVGTPEEKFIDTRWNYRQRLENWDAWWHSSVHWRAHNGNELQTLVSDNQLYWVPNKYFDVQTNLNLYYQAGAADDDIQGAWSAYGSVAGSWKYYWNNRTRNEVEVQLFARQLSEDQMPLQAVDDDIVSQYKLDHGYGMRLSDRFYYQPWLDSRFHAGAQVTLNEFGEGDLIDKWSVESGWRQYWRPWRLAADVRYTRYMADAHRSRGLSSTLFSLSLDYELWQSRGSLWQFSFDVRHDINRNSTGAFFGISWNHTDGQGYNDFAPPTQIFSSLRQRHGLQVIDTNDIVIQAAEVPDEN